MTALSRSPAARSPIADAGALASGARFARLDALRGVAIVWMAVFHFCFDLNRYGLMHPPQEFLSDPFWTWQRTSIVSLFLFCAGLGQAVALDAGQPWARFWKRWLQVAGCAVLVTAGSWWMFPQSPITFGVLHGIAVMLLLVRLLAPLLPRSPAGIAAWLALGAIALVLPSLWSHPFFDTRWTNWVGLVTRLPFTQDYVPVLPWLGVVMAGMATGQWLLPRRRAVLDGPLPAVLRPLAALGRWSLSFYMVHQPVLVAITMGLLAWSRG